MARAYDYRFPILKIKTIEISSNSFKKMIISILCHIVLVISNARFNLHVTI